MKEEREIKSQSILKRLAIGWWILGGLVLISAGAALKSQAATGAPTIISYQGRLTNSSGQLLGGAGTTYYFKFSIWDNPTVNSGIKLWPSSAPGVATSTVVDGVFNVNIGDTTHGYPDELNYNFNSNNTVYLQVEVSADNNDANFEKLSPRQQITASGFAINANTVAGASPGTAANNILKLGSSGEINIGGAIVTNSTLQGGASLTSGTALLINTAGGFSGNLVDLQVNGASKLSVTQAGALSLNGTVAITGAAGSTAPFNIASSSGVSLLHVTATGNVGIGTITPLAVLQIQGTSTNPTYNLFSVASSTGTTLLTVTPSGNVGIGTTTPQTEFVVVGTTTLAGDLVPAVDAIYSLGTPDNQWKSLYVAASTIYIGGATLSTSGSQLHFNGNTVIATTTPSFTSVALTNALGTAHGGTGTSTAPSQTGQLLASNGTGWGVANLVNGANITITTSSPGSITITAADSLSSWAGLTGPAITIATTSETNLGLEIITGSNNATFTPVWIGTLADSRIASAATWNGKAASTTSISTTYPLQGGGDLQSSRTLNVAMGDLTLGTNLSFTSGDGKLILLGTSTQISLSATPAFTSVSLTNALTAANGGTGTTSAPTQTGQVLAADGTGSKYAPATLVNGANIVITTSTPGSITIAASGLQPAGTYVTSVTGTSPIVSSGGTTPAISVTTGDLTLGSNLSFTTGDGKLILLGTSTQISISSTPSFASTTLSNLTAGFVKTTSGGSVYTDSLTYLTANQSITISGVVSGSGATSITTTFASTTPIVYGGTGTTTSPTVIGQVLAASANGAWGVSNLVAGSNITLTTSSPGSITIAASGSTGLSSWAGRLILIKNATNDRLLVAILTSNHSPLCKVYHS